MSIIVKRRANGNVIVTIGVNDTVEIRAESGEVALASASNTYQRPKSQEDVDIVEVRGKRREDDLHHG